ncbi:hypothetical protein [uncultured Dysosmobacter sp.]|uniref:hypothetical protein n=1 Tax=uncultured Dysosmobacter sp. TaxID=2591384 RepID=UPI0026713872|nr:hypothetical protein [uncultured Dysosmobacter sp.]
MKVYEKPKLIAMSLSGNNRLCGDCAGGITLWDHKNIAEAILILVRREDKMLDGITEDDFVGVFGTGDGCTTPTEIYCKFTSTGDQVAWS